MKKLFGPFATKRSAWGLLSLRLVAGSALMFHGWTKVQNPFEWLGPRSAVPGLFQFLAALSEFGGGLAMILGLLTPIAAFGVICTMAYATFMHISRGDPFVARGGSYEAALVHGVIALTMILTGPGAFSADAILFGDRRLARAGRAAPSADDGSRSLSEGERARHLRGSFFRWLHASNFIRGAAHSDER